jgi:RNA-binding protein
MATLTAKQRAFLQALAHDKKPVILLGKNGITDAVVKETQQALLTHELIKARLSPAEGREDLDSDAAQLASRAGAELVALLGRMAVLYKAHPEKPKIKFPKKKRGLFDVDEG